MAIFCQGGKSKFLSFKELMGNDLIIVGEVGGYDIPTANVWTKPAPAIYGIKNSSLVIIRKAQTWKDVIR